MFPYEDLTNKQLQKLMKYFNHIMRQEKNKLKTSKDDGPAIITYLGGKIAMIDEMLMELYSEEYDRIMK